MVGLSQWWDSLTVSGGTQSVVGLTVSGGTVRPSGRQLTLMVSSGTHLLVVGHSQWWDSVNGGTQSVVGFSQWWD